MDLRKHARRILLLVLALLPSFLLGADSGSTRPNKPENCSASQPWFDIHISWWDNSNNELGFIVEYKDGPIQLTWTVPADSSNLYLSGYVYGTMPGSFRVRAFNASGTSAPSNWADTRHGGAGA